MICVLLSGGIDSAFLLSRVVETYKTVQCLFLDYGQPVAIQERIAAESVALHYGVPLQAIPMVHMGETMKQGIGTAGARVVPNRNQTFLVYAHQLFPEAELGIGANANDYDDYVDCRPEFFHDLGSKLGVKIHSLTHLSKREIIRQSNLNGVPLRKTWSCYESDNDAQCGKCNSCEERKHNTFSIYDFYINKRARILRKIR